VKIFNIIKNALISTIGGMPIFLLTLFICKYLKMSNNEIYLLSGFLYGVVTSDINNWIEKRKIKCQ